MRTVAYRVEERYAGCSVSGYLRDCHGYSRRFISRLKQGRGSLAVNGAAVAQLVSTRLREGDCVTLTYEEAQPRFAPNSDLRAPLLYEDADVAVFGKPPGLPSHPSPGHSDDTLANLCAALWGENAGFHLVNRLDKDTSGCVVVAKHPYAAARLAHGVEKRYFAVAEGLVEPPSGVINAPIARAEGSIIRRRVDSSGKPAATRYRTLRTGNGHTLLELRLETGRTHQIRVHLSWLGFPLAGDTLYGGRPGEAGRQALHCGEVRFPHPVSGEEVLVRAPLPEHFAALLGERQNIQPD